MKFIHFFLLVCLCSFCACEVHTKPKAHVAICYWGLTRSTKQVYKSHDKKLFKVLRDQGIDYDVFMHTWHTNSKQRIQTVETDCKVDYQEYKLLHPNYYKIDDQDLFTATLPFHQYFYQDVWDAKGQCGEGEWFPQLILNHLCALESQKRVTDMVLNSGNSYDLIIYVRPDAKLKNQFPAHLLSAVKEGDILIPNFANHEGYNDRCAVMKPQTAAVYGKRIDGLAEFRKTQGRIVSEKYVKYVCDQHHLNVVFMDFNFDLVRPK